MQKQIKSLLVIAGCIGHQAWASESSINFNALCYESKNACIEARALVSARSQLPIYSYVKPCVLDQISPERGRSFCAQGQWRLATQIRSNWSEPQITRYLNKHGFAPLRTSCVDSHRRAREIIELIAEGAGGTWQSMKGNYQIRVTYRSATPQELTNARNKECEAKPLLVEYQLSR